MEGNTHTHTHTHTHTYMLYVYSSLFTVKLQNIPEQILSFLHYDIFSRKQNKQTKTNHMPESFNAKTFITNLSVSLKQFTKLLRL